MWGGRDQGVFLIELAALCADSTATSQMCAGPEELGFVVLRGLRFELRASHL
jgi:hypothetical protein